MSYNHTDNYNSGFSGALSGVEAGSAFGPVGSVVGGILGGIGGFFGHGNHEPSLNEKAFNESVRQFNVQDDYNKNLTQYRVKDAMKAGVNPLAALGYSGNYSPTVSAGYGGDSSSSSPSFNDSLRQLSEIFNKQQAESNELDLEGKRLDNEYKRGLLANLNQPGIPLNHDLGSMSNKDEIPNLYKPWRTQDGSIVYLIDPDAIADTDITNLGTWQAGLAGVDSLGSWLRDVILPKHGSWNDRYLPLYSTSRKLLTGFFK